MEKAIFAVDELSGFIVAVALVMPNRALSECRGGGYEETQVQGFAAKVNRDEIRRGSSPGGFPRGNIQGRCWRGLQAASVDLGL